MKNVLPEPCRSAFILLLLSLLSAGCYKSSAPYNNNHQYTFEDRAEADVIAICLSGAITAPQGLSRRVLADLAEIRSRFGEEFGQINAIRFKAPWDPSRVTLHFDSETSQLVAKGQYHAWDELNQRFQVSNIELREDYAKLSFKGQLHAHRVSELYEELPGIRYANMAFLMDGSRLYPSGQEMSEMRYLFKYAWGDCEAGCIMGEFWYFIVSASGETRFVGNWDPYKEPQVPDWWADAKLNIELYRTF